MSASTSPIILVTGATGGIGYATARELVAAGARVIVHGPTAHSAGEAMRRLVEGGADPGRLDIAVADFTRLDDVVRLARLLADSYAAIDVLVNNAAVAGPESRTVTGDGHELTFQVDYLAPVLLTRLLAPQLRAARGRMVALSSSLHRTGNINWSDPQRHKHYSPLAAYAQAKLTLTMFARALAQQQPDITAVSVHPGIVETDLRRLYAKAGEPAEEACAVVAALCSPDTAVVDGGYYDRTVPAVPAPLVDNDAAVARLWKLTTRLLGQDRFVPAPPHSTKAA